MKHIVRVTTVEVTPDEDEWPSASLADFIKWARAQLKSIAPEYRDSATITFDTCKFSFDRPAEPVIRIQHDAPESDEDYERRQREDAATREQLKSSERFRLIQLMNKYPDITDRFRPREVSPGHFRPAKGAIFLDD